MSLPSSFFVNNHAEYKLLVSTLLIWCPILLLLAAYTTGVVAVEIMFEVTEENATNRIKRIMKKPLLLFLTISINL
jgi:hypothetical protein